MDAQTFIAEIGKMSSKEIQEEQKELFVCCIKAADLILCSDVYHLGSMNPFDGNDEIRKSFKEIAARCTVQAMLRVDDYQMKNRVVDNKESIQKWLNDNEEKYGPYILRKCLEHRGMNGYFENKQVWQDIVNTLVSESYIVGSLVRVLAESQEFPQRMIGVIESYSKEDGQRVRDRWKNYKEAPELAAVMAKSARWFDSYSSNVEVFIDSFAGDVKGACMRTDRSETYTEEELLSMGDTGITIYDLITYRRDYQGEKIIAWLAGSEEVKNLGLCTGIGGSNTTVTKISSERKQSGCVIENTRLLMADGRAKRIQDVQEGDLLINGRGQVSRCSGELIKTEHIKYFYGLNGGQPLFSLEHAVMTEEGWKSLDPQNANNINPNHQVSQLKVGDIFVKASFSRDGKIKYTKEVIRSIDIAEFPEGKTGYDLHFAEGYSSYCAEGIVCLLNYPEMTISNITNNINKNMSPEEQEKFYELLTQNQNLFEKAIGHTPTQKLMEALPVS